MSYWQYNGIQVSIDASDYSEMFKVAIRANNPTIRRSSILNVPEPTQMMFDWLAENNIDHSSVKISNYDLVNQIEDILGLSSDPYFQIFVLFENPNDAILFKLTWSGYE